MVKDITIESGLKTILDGSSRITEQKDKASGVSFNEMLKQTISEVNDLQKEAEASTASLLKGDASIHDTMLSLEKADLSFRFMMKVRTKILDAYQEVMRMQV